MYLTKRRLDNLVYELNCCAAQLEDILEEIKTAAAIDPALRNAANICRIDDTQTPGMTVGDGLQRTMHLIDKVVDDLDTGMDTLENVRATLPVTHFKDKAATVLRLTKMQPLAS